MKAIDLLRPFVDSQYGSEVDDLTARLAEFEASLPGPLPQDYVEVLLDLKRATGLHPACIEPIGKPHPRVPGMFSQADEQPPIDILYGLQSDHWNLFAAWRQLAWRMPPELVPIATDMMSSQICIDVSPDFHGKVYHWFIDGDPGPVDENGRAGWGNVFLLADSFTDLCRRIRLLDYSNIPKVTGARICFNRLAP